MLNRRDFLGRLALGCSMWLWPPLARAETLQTRPRLVVVLLRGALDGLTALPCPGDPAYASLRGDLAAALQSSAPMLNDTFALHPALSFCHQRFLAGDMAAIHACGQAYRGRSHFSAQDCLENGTDHPGGSRTGWLNRAVGEQAHTQGVSLTDDRPLMIRGPAPITSWVPAPTSDATRVLAARMNALYRHDERLGPAFARALEMQRIVSDDVVGGSRLEDIMPAAGRFLAPAEGASVALIDDQGWDTHARQNAVLARKLADLDHGLSALHRQLGASWRHTAVVVMTEFGRTVRVNGSGGTDHGTASCVLLAGGAIRGGKVHGDWPGLARLRDNRDLVAAQDIRSVLKGVLRDHLGLQRAALDTTVFPDSRTIAPFEGLIRAT
ncbi:DUF1501 domain-containing protein [Halomonas sp. DP5Y7-2]|uniref:DUF1501 domain-containing protein n=1 Tax=Halomonas sp. DP5Y7-2 TaxID=2859076 RepID=UPI001C997623|nr:DUF1501 domain-containing protein [Halomonas sp. DP5Y7-2]MBY5984374.1 DUF1501 domain-containing protein [Halomonas sp. DP5Y7-2]